MNILSILSTVTTLLVTLGGWEAVKYFINRKPNARIKEAEADIKETEADSAEFGLLKETIEFLQEQVKQYVQMDAEKERRFTEQTQRLRETQDREYKLMQEKAALELEVQKYRCIRPKCVDREPQNGY